MSEDVQKKVLEWFQKQKKSKFYIKDIEKGLSDIPKAEVKNAVKAMVETKTLEYWSSGSTTYIMLPGKQEE
jgi:hypothetical protein